VYTEIWWGNLREKDHLEDPGLDGMVILKWIYMNWAVGVGLDRSGSVWGQLAGICECGNEPSVSIKYGEFLE
jgi:hypothetical protein